MELLTFAMATTPPSPLIATITDRMPALLDEAGHATWLGETSASLADIKATLKTSDRELTMTRAGKPPPPPKKPKPPEPDRQPDLF
jgi:putative SOS response-associated peptidase YedK